MTGILDHVEDRPLLDCLGDSPMTAGRARQLVLESLDDLAAFLELDQLQQVKEAFAEHGLL